MMRSFLLSLLLTSTCFALSGSFSITPADAGDKTLIDATSIAEGAKGNNYGTATTARIGLNLGSAFKRLLRYNSMDDSMRAIAATPGLTIVSWDSMRVFQTVTTKVTAGDSLSFAVYELKSTRRFGEGTANGAAGLGASWWDYDSTSGVQALWTTQGAASSTSDYESTLLDTTRTYMDTTSAPYEASWKIPGTSVADTLNNAGLLFVVYHYGTAGDDDGVANAIFALDDNATTSYRPRCTVYYTYTMVVVSRGTGRFGRNDKGVYLGVR